MLFARFYILWPNRVKNFVNVYSECDFCKQKVHNQTKSVIYQMEFLFRLWQRLHIAFACTIFRFTKLAYQNAYS